MDQRKPEGDRESKPQIERIPSDPEEIARREAANALRQFDAVVKLVDGALQSSRSFRLRPSTALDLNRIATEGTNEYPGVFRPHSVIIVGSSHQSPEVKSVPSLVEEMCDYVNENWGTSPIHLAAYLLWRMNWVHPFSDGNGRTARALSYAVLCIRLGYRLPGARTIPEQISADKSPYYKALESADEAWSEERVDVGDLEDMLGAMLAVQLVEVHREATGSQG